MVRLGAWGAELRRRRVVMAAVPRGILTVRLVLRVVLALRYVLGEDVADVNNETGWMDGGCRRCRRCRTTQVTTPPPTK